MGLGLRLRLRLRLRESSWDSRFVGAIALLALVAAGPVAAAEARAKDAGSEVGDVEVV